MVEDNNCDNIEDPQQCGCQGSCSTPASGSYSKWKLVVVIIILSAAGIIMARSLMKQSNSSGSPCCPSSAGPSDCNLPGK